MKSIIITLLPVLLLCIVQVRFSSSIEVIISPRCFGRISSCRTLSSVPPGTNVTLVFEHGVHTVPSSALMLQHKKYLELKGNGLATVSCTPIRYRSNIRISYISKVVISGLTFSGCNVEFRHTNDTTIENATFIDGINGALEFSQCQNVTIDKSHFNNNSDSSFGGAIEFSNTKGIEVTRNNFSNNHVSSFAGVIGLSHSFGTISCTNFHNNSAGSFGGIVTLECGSSLYISNSSFNNSTLSSFGGVIHLDSTDDNVVVISSVFTENRHSSFGGVINLDSSKSRATIIASKFINTWRHSRHGVAVYSDSNDVTFDCNEFVNTTIPIHHTRYNTGFCTNYNLDISATCSDTTCKLTDCKAPAVKVSLEKSEYVVNEDIGKSDRALQVCAVAKDLQFRVKANLLIHNRSATELDDFITGSPDCRVLNFNRKAGTQKECVYIRIVEDTIKEEDEQFDVVLESSDPPVVFETKRATVTITEDDLLPARPAFTERQSNDITTAVPPGSENEGDWTSYISPEPVTSKPISGLSKTAVVECGLMRREITYKSGGNDLDNLKTAIIQALGRLTGIESNHIALLQVKSDTYGDYIDEPFPSSIILHDKSQVRVITYDHFSCRPRYSR